MPTKTVLVVDDNVLNRKLLEGVLRIVPAEMISAEDGAEGIRLAKEHRPDLILMDVQLPDMDGFDVIAEIRRDPELAGIPYYYLTGNIAPEHHQKAATVGCLGIVQKPIAVGTFVESLKELLA
ncbi:MAG: response regulator [Desulfosarcinaceae bacterium]|nr:response regulator [Desulfosarcinaceae bacterium]